MEKSQSLFNLRSKINELSPKEIDMQLKTIAKSFGNKLSTSDIQDIMYYATDKDKMAKIIIEYADVELPIDILLQHSRNCDEIAKLIVVKLNVNLQSNDIENLINYVKNKTKFAKLVISVMGEKLTGVNILMAHCHSVNNMAKSIIDIKGKTLEGSDVIALMAYSSDKDEVAKMIVVALGEEISVIGDLMRHTRNKDDIAKLIIKTKADKLSGNDVYYLLSLCKNKGDVANLIIETKGYDNLTVAEKFQITHFTKL